MQTLEALLEKKIPDDYMENYKRTISSKQLNNLDKESSESNGCDQPTQNGESIVISSADGLVSSNALVRTMPLTALSSNGVTGNGNFKVASNVYLSPEGGISHLKNGLVQIRSSMADYRLVTNHKRRLLPAINGVPTEETFRLPAPISDGRKKFKMSTVPKMVPLINTVGNQSKLLPLQVPISLSAEVGQNSMSSTSPQIKSLLKPSSILEARLSTKQVAGTSSMQISSDSEANSVSSKNGLPEFSEPTLEKVPPNQGYTVQKNRKTTISFERGATRIVSSKAKNTKTVDIGVQVYMPDPDEDLEGNPILPNLMPPLQPISSATSGPMQPAASITTMPTNEYVILDTKNGKRILTIPKKMNGTKTFVIDGKCASISQPGSSNVAFTKSILLSDPALGQTRSNLVTAASLPCDTVTTPSSKGQLSISTPVQVPSSSSVVLSVASPAGTSRSIQAVIDSSALNYKHSVSADRLVLPLNSPVTIDGKLCSLDSSMDLDTSSQSPFQITASNSDSIVLPLNSPIKASSINRQNNNKICTIPNTTSLFILVPNDRNQETPLEHESGEGFACNLNVLKRKANGFKLGNTLLKKRCPELPKSSSDVAENCVNGGMQQSHERVHISPDSAISSNEPLAPVSKEEMNNLVKNAFSEFKNCLVLDRDGKMPIHSAVENNDLAAVKRQCIILKARRSSVNVLTSKEESPLQLALYHGHSSIAALLLQHGADAAFIDQEGNTALHLAVTYAADVFESVFLSGQSIEGVVNNLNDEGFSALHLAAQHDKVTAIEWLIKHGALVDLPDGKCGRTALFLAIERKSYKAQKALLSYGADMKEPTFSGSTPFLLTKGDTIAHLTSGQDAVAEFIDSDLLLRSSSPSEDN